MIGLFYMGWVMVSHVGAKIKEFHHYANRHVDKQTNTYVDIYGHRRDEATGQLRTMVIENNGDVVLLDKKHNVVRNISQEERYKKWKEGKENSSRNLIMETALETKERRETCPISPVSGEAIHIKGTIHLDYDTGEAYYQVPVYVDRKYCKNTFEEIKYFYVRVNEPFDLVRISDRQKKSEKASKENGFYNWIDDPKSEEDFIAEYNKRPYRSNDITIKTKKIRINAV